jgi:hypothetical protein
MAKRAKVKFSNASFDDARRVLLIHERDTMDVVAVAMVDTEDEESDGEAFKRVTSRMTREQRRRVTWQARYVGNTLIVNDKGLFEVQYNAR